MRWTKNTDEGKARMLHTIQNEFLTVTASRAGAQLQSIRTTDGAELLWQGDPAYWRDRALNLFPYVARLWQGKYTLDGNSYEMPIHGFAPGSRFDLAHHSETSMTFALQDSEETYAQYPRRFCLRIVYELEGSSLKTTYEVENRDTQTMYFGLGGHPGFNVPLEEGRRFEDYVLRFGGKCMPVRVGFSEDCFLNGEDKRFALEDGHLLALRHDLFDDDAIVLGDMAREVTLMPRGGGRSVTVSFADMPYLGIWHWPKTDAPYVCLEPWCSLPSRRGEITALEEKRDLIRLEAGETTRRTFSIRVGTAQADA